MIAIDSSLPYTIYDIAKASSGIPRSFDTL